MPYCPKHECDVNDVIALRLLRSCPKALSQSDLPENIQIALRSLHVIFKRANRRPIALSGQNTPAISTDERCLINILAASQTDDKELQKQFLSWLTYQWAHNKLLSYFDEIAAFLKETGITLSPSITRPPARRHEPGLYALIGSKASVS